MSLNWSEEDVKRHNERVKKGRTEKPEQPAAGQKKMQALGRLKTGQMNKTEERFAQYLDLQKHAGTVQWWKFEGIKLMLAPNTSITVDFALLPADGVLTMIDVKGSKAIYTDDARAKMKVAAAMYPFVFKVAYPKPKKQGDGWLIEEI